MTSINAHKLAKLATTALTTEVTLAPKPGLVDPVSNGAHRDMDYALFIKSIEALAPYFDDYVTLGATSVTLPVLFDALRKRGVVAEQAMLTATNQINTHKGANFSFAFILGAIGWCQKHDGLGLNYHRVFETVSTMTAGMVARDFKHLEQKSVLSYGEKLYLEHGLTGIRGEAEEGYPILQKEALPFLARWQAVTPEERYLRLMVHLMATVSDMNLIHRGGLEAWQRVQAEAQKLEDEQLSLESLKRRLADWDDAFIQAHLSPGGTADILALAIFFDQLSAIDD
ncbi:triphosphoribosyl-dephospho-CoA synthase CitG [Lacticaseibacillus saniviri]|nr:triphosphoribosyl-dephospho-CoA synthase CitG [Lacticaseibacillus saniviri]MCG4282147.1 triphosphoribosyl-dephospho-CoA synthase CitG [Lacticaseibacillus saniviri]